MLFKGDRSSDGSRRGQRVWRRSSRRGQRIRRRLGAQAVDPATTRGTGGGSGLGQRRRGKREGPHCRRRLLPPRADAGGAPHHAAAAPSLTPPQHPLRAPPRALGAPPPPHPQITAATRVARERMCVARERERELHGGWIGFLRVFWALRILVTFSSLFFWYFGHYEY
ncbi:Os08g0103100 [Oryza sativa Japonica Group]|uniref:Os08g0103100 protein n=1 Tax=Oryza sativa subsp. japonica TaxID=39947 RepID=Q0J8N1_ORYSJ|nr:Os08g0103100 [Oryza sativa Japonica Group]|eukprot:NP_001060770.1 Os08g0103100 [Oryza sativa Japonica Group]